jgi:ribosomal protein L32
MISNDVVQVVRFRNCDNVVRCHVGQSKRLKMIPMVYVSICQHKPLYNRICLVDMNQKRKKVLWPALE